MKLATFIDISYLKQRDLGWQIDIKKLSLLVQKLADKMVGAGSVAMCRNIVVGSLPVNVSPLDKNITDRLSAFFNVIGSFPCFEINVVPLDYHGYRIRKEDRLMSLNPFERSFIPTEKAVDTTLVVRMMELLHRDRAFDVACVISGDQDMVPAVRSLRNSGCFVFVAGINVHQTLSSVFSQDNVPIVDLAEHRSDLERSIKVSQELQIEIDDLYNEIESTMYLMTDWTKDRILAHLNIWTCKARLLGEKLTDENTDAMREVFSLLASISRQFQPGFVPALKKSHQGHWSQIIRTNEERLKELELAGA